MHLIPKILFVSLALVAAAESTAQDAVSTVESDQLKIAALEALMSVPPERALPLVSKVLSGDSSDEVKSSALFVLSQIELPEAQAILIETATTGSGELKLNAIRMIGISGDPGTMASLSEIYASGDSDIKGAVLEAYMITEDSNAIYEIAANTTSDEEFEKAVSLLGAMGATEELRNLRSREGNLESLVEAYAIAGDFESLHELAIDSSNPELQQQAIQGLGIVGGSEVNSTLMEIYRTTDSPVARSAALEGMMIADYDEGVLELFRTSQDPQEKRELLQMLVMMDSDAAMDAIEKALDGGL